MFPVELTEMFGAHTAVLGFDALRKMFGMVAMDDRYLIRLICVLTTCLSCCERSLKYWFLTMFTFFKIATLVFLVFHWPAAASGELRKKNCAKELRRIAQKKFSGFVMVIGLECSLPRRHLWG